MVGWGDEENTGAGTRRSQLFFGFGRRPTFWGLLVWRSASHGGFEGQ